MCWSLVHREIAIRFSIASIGQDQDKALLALARLIAGCDPHTGVKRWGHGLEHPLVRTTALRIVNDAGCAGRDEECELEALYEWVKKHFPYRADPKSIDFFVAPERSLMMMKHGAPGGDCDEHVTVLGALAGSLGFTVGARAYARHASEPFEHVYAVALLPKKEEDPERGKIVGLDTTVDSAYVGWQPYPGRYRTAWIDSEVRGGPIL